MTMAMTERRDIQISVAGPERLEGLRSVWESLSDHHAAVAPRLRELGPVRLGADSWAVRRRHYASLFEGESVAFALIAEADDAAVGYAMVDLRGPEESWDTGPVAVLETLAVLPDHRGSGIGTALIEAVFSELRTRGIGHWEVATIATNADAIRFYERLDLLPFTVNFIGRVPVGTDRAE